MFNIKYCIRMEKLRLFYYVKELITTVKMFTERGIVTKLFTSVIYECS
jgi:hypothetical protein